jgi:hypothetical protein
MFRKIVPGTLAPYQMAWFLINCNITNVLIWSDLSFDQAKQLFDNLQTGDRQPLLITKKIDDIPHPNSTLLTSKSSIEKGKVVLHQWNNNTSTTSTSKEKQSWPLFLCKEFIWIGCTSLLSHSLYLGLCEFVE